MTKDIEGMVEEYHDFMFRIARARDMVRDKKSYDICAQQNSKEKLSDILTQAKTQGAQEERERILTEAKCGVEGGRIEINYLEEILQNNPTRS